MKLLVVALALTGCVIDDDTEDEVNVEQEGVSLNGVSLAAGKAQPLTGAAIVGSTWTGTAANSTTVKLRIDSAQQGTGPSSDLWFYGSSYQQPTGTWAPICGTERVLGVAGVWSATAAYAPSASQFTLACRGTTVAKCVELGYKPHKGYATQLASCTRAGGFAAART